MQLGSFHRRARHPQQGYILLLLMLTVAIIAIGLTAAAANYARMIRRDREVEMIHRGAQYARAIRLYQHRFRQYPTSLDQLEKANNMRFLRKRYADPMVPDGQWRVLHDGDVQLSMTGAATTPTGGLGGLNPQGGTSGAAGGQSPSGGTGSAFGLTTTGTGPGNVIGGGPIIGVSSLSTEEGVHEFNGKRAYKDWLFIYVQAQDVCAPPTGGCLIDGPYNPNRFIGKIATPTPMPGGGNAPGQIGAPGVPIPPSTNPAQPNPTQPNPTFPQQ